MTDRYRAHDLHTALSDMSIQIDIVRGDIIDIFQGTQTIPTSLAVAYNKVNTIFNHLSDREIAKFKEEVMQ